MSSNYGNSILFANYNQDATSLLVGSHIGFSIYSLENMKKLKRSYENKHMKDVIIVERYYSSSLVTVVSRQSPRKLCIYHIQENSEIFPTNFTNSILAVKMNKKHLIVCIEEHIFVHNVKDAQVTHVIRDTPPNTNGVIDLTSSGDSLIAYPGSVKTGEVHIFDATNLTALGVTITAHSNPLAALKFSYDGKYLATASVRGTVIRVFGIPSGERLFEFQRGSWGAAINSLAFSMDGQYLASSSNTETVHVFKLDKSSEDQPQLRQNVDDSASSWMGYFSKAASEYLPTQMSEILQRGTSFAFAKLPTVGQKNVVALPVIDGKLRLIVTTSDGYLYCYSIERLGGECELTEQHRVGPGYDQKSHRGEICGGNEVLGVTTGRHNEANERHCVDNEDAMGDRPPMSHSAE
ncbi:hypothetical protein AB6A40_003662 [Gnathostoma spinigerum]|uniref:WD repeat domain phosphoinositide-interacting protein 2 n=1 Tax=Gnathostoma spinigerum TaxID=75299 RepID=A0ABD6EAC9_9BILA